MLEGVFRRITTQAGGWLRRLGGRADGRRAAAVPPIADALVLSAAACRAAGAKFERKIPLAMRKLEWEVRELNANQADRLRRVLADPKGLNGDRHGATNGINIWLNEVRAKVKGAGPEAGAAWADVHGPLMAEVDRLQARTNGLQLRYTGGRHEPNPWIPGIALPHADAARAAQRLNPAVPTPAEFEGLATSAIGLAERINAAMKG